MKDYILAIDQGTTSTRSIIYNKDLVPIASDQLEIKQYYPNNGWVEHDASEIWLSVQKTVQNALKKAKLKPEQILSIGITNQRETLVVWDKHTRRPLYNAIVWQSRQSSDICEGWKEEGYSELIKAKTGLEINAYFTASKLVWLLQQYPEIYQKAINGEILVGTIDSWLLYNFTNGKVHATDYSNASRTMLYNIFDLKWDDELLELFNIPKNILPEVKDSSSEFGYTCANSFLNTEILIGGIAGDQQAALFGQTCFNKGNVKNTYGTGCFLLMNTEQTPIISNQGLLTTIGWGLNGEICYALEGSILVAGSAISWLKDAVKLIETPADTDYFIKKTDSNNGVYFVPAFVGLGAPYWDENVRGTILGLTQATGKEYIIRATLESIAYQTKDVLEIMEAESEIAISALKVDGGITKNNFLMQFQADILGMDVQIAKNAETTALGVAMLAGLAGKLFKSKQDILRKFRAHHTVSANMDFKTSNAYYTKWKKAVSVAQMFKD